MEWLGDTIASFFVSAKGEGSRRDRSARTSVAATSVASPVEVVGLSYETVIHTWTTRPDGTAWTDAAVDALQAGIELAPGGTASTVRVTQVYVRVNVGVSSVAYSYAAGPTGMNILTYTYDAKGNWLTRKEGTTTSYYVYDASKKDDRLCGIDTSSGKTCASAATRFTYDVLGQMATRTSGGTTTTRPHFDAVVFLSKVVRACRDRPLVYTDAGPRYPWPLRQYGFPYERRMFGPRSAIERWFGVLKRRTPRSHNLFPYRSSERSVMEWMEAWVRFYNWRVLS